MATQVYVRPAPGARVRLPARGYQVLGPEGGWVELDPFMRRRVADGEVIVGAPPAAAVPAEAMAAEAMESGADAPVTTNEPAPRARGKREG